MMSKLDLTEFDILEQMLQSADIKYEREDGGSAFLHEFHQLRHPANYGDKWLWDVICSTGSYGSERGLLEIWGKDIDDPIGWLTAEECLEKIKAILYMEDRRRLENNA